MKQVNQSEHASGSPKSMGVVAAGLCCSLGYRLDAAVSAIRANMDHFQESAFYSPSGSVINAALLPDDVFGHARLARWVGYAVRDCASRLPDPRVLLSTERTGIILLAPDQGRQHASNETYRKIVLSAMDRLKEDLEQEPSAPAQAAPYDVVVIDQGRTGLAEGLLNAARLFVSGQSDQVLLIGVDSYLNARDINSFLSEKRLMVKGNSNGFIPGEAAAAVLLRPVESDSPGMHIKGVGIGEEAGRHDGSVPSRAQGLSKAMRDACAQAKMEPTDLMFHVSDQNGELFYSNEAANALTRVMFGGHKLTQLTLADKIGEVGSATGPSMLAWLHLDMANADHSPGDKGILHFANDNGARCAVVVRYYGD